MTWLWCVLGAIVLLLLLVLSLRVGVLITLRDTPVVSLRIGPVNVPLYPAKAKEKAPKQTKQSPSKPQKEKKPRQKLDLTSQDVKEALKAAWQAVKGVLRRIGRGIRIDPLVLSIIVGGPEPDRVAQQYGQLSAAVWTVMPQLEKLIHIRDPYIHMDVDFNAPATNVEGSAGIYLRVVTLFAVAFAAAKPLLTFYFPFRRRQKARSAAAEGQRTANM